MLKGTFCIFYFYLVGIIKIQFTQNAALEINIPTVVTEVDYVDQEIKTFKTIIVFFFYK